MNDTEIFAAINAHADQAAQRRARAAHIRVRRDQRCFLRAVIHTLVLCLFLLLLIALHCV